MFKLDPDFKKDPISQTNLELHLNLRDEGKLSIDAINTINTLAGINRKYVAHASNCRLLAELVYNLIKDGNVPNLAFTGDKK